MSGVMSEASAAFEVGDRKHVSACLEQGGFARIVHLGPQRIALVGPDGLPWRHVPPLPPCRTWKRKASEPVIVARPNGPSLAEQSFAARERAAKARASGLTPLAAHDVIVGGLTLSPTRLLILQHLADGGRERWSRADLAAAIDRSIDGLSFLTNPLIAGGYVAKQTEREGRVTRLYLLLTDAGRRLYEGARIAAAGPRPDGRVAPYLRRALAEISPGMTAADLARRCGVSMSMARTLVSRLMALDLVERERASRGLKRTARGNRALALEPAA